MFTKWKIEIEIEDAKSKRNFEDEDEENMTWWSVNTARFVTPVSTSIV